MKKRRGVEDWESKMAGLRQGAALMAQPLPCVKTLQLAGDQLFHDLVGATVNT